MKRVPALVEWSRRDFCTACTAGLAALIAACTDHDRDAIATGGLDDAGDGQPDIDAAGSGSGSGSGSAGTCGTAPSTDVGAAASYATGTPKYFATGKFFVVKDANGFYALTAKCTHEGVACTVSGTRFRCPRHGALFTLDGAVVSGPVSRPLAHYAMCLLPNGNLGVVTSMIVAATVRLVP